MEKNKGVDMNFLFLIFYIMLFIGESLCLAEAVRKYGNGKPYGTVVSRITRNGWDPEKAILK